MQALHQRKHWSTTACCLLDALVRTYTQTQHKHSSSISSTVRQTIGLGANLHSPVKLLVLAVAARKRPQTAGWLCVPQ